MVKNRLSQEDAQASGWLLDGYPRSAEQAEAIEEAGIRPDVFILINVSHLWCSHAGSPTIPDFAGMNPDLYFLMRHAQQPCNQWLHHLPPLIRTIPDGRQHRGRLQVVGRTDSAATRGRAQVPDQELVERVTGRRLDPHTGLIYHLKFKPPPAEALERLIQRSDDTEAKLRNRLDTHHANVAAVLGYYKDITVEVPLLAALCCPPVPACGQRCMRRDALL